MTRTFAAIFPPPEVREKLRALIDDFKKVCSGTKWVEKENIHLTLRFFGDLTDDQVAAASSCMKELSLLERPFKIRLGSPGAFPSAGLARVIWVGTAEGKEKLVGVANALEERFIQAGLGRTDKPFSPHLTIGRVKIPQRNPGLEEAIRTLTFPGAEFMIDALTLTKSELRPEGPLYCPLSVVRLGTDE